MKRSFSSVTLPAAYIKKNEAIVYATVYTVCNRDDISQMFRVISLSSFQLSDANVAKLKKLIVRISRLIDEGNAIEKVAAAFKLGVAQLKTRDVLKAKTTVVNEEQLERLLGIAKTKPGHVALVSDVADLQQAIAGGSGIAGSIVLANLFGEATIGAVFAGATAAGAAVAGLSVLLAAGGGYLIGTAADQAFLEPLWSGETLQEFKRSDVVGNDEGESTDIVPNEPGPETDDEPAADDSETDNPETDATPDEPGEEDDDEEEDDDDEPAADDSETANPEADASSSVGALLLLLASGLGQSEVERQLDAIGIFRGGDVGAPIITPGSMLDLNEHLIAIYLRGLTSFIEARRNKYGQRVVGVSSGPIDMERLLQLGITDPSPLDLHFWGETGKTIGLPR